MVLQYYGTRVLGYYSTKARRRRAPIWVARRRRAPIWVARRRRALIWVARRRRASIWVARRRRALIWVSYVSDSSKCLRMLSVRILSV